MNTRIGLIGLVLVGLLNVVYAEECDYDVVSIRLVTEEQLTHFLGDEDSNMVLEVEKDFLLPFAFEMDGDWLVLEGAKESSFFLRSKQTFYLRLAEGLPLFSMDLSMWLPFEEFATGELGCKVEFSEEGLSRLKLYAEHHLRERKE